MVKYYNIDCILKVVRTRKRALVKWEGGDQTWEPIRGVSHTQPWMDWAAAHRKRRYRKVVLYRSKYWSRANKEKRSITKSPATIPKKRGAKAQAHAHAHAAASLLGLSSPLPPTLPSPFFVALKDELEEDMDPGMDVEPVKTALHSGNDFSRFVDGEDKEAPQQTVPLKTPVKLWPSSYDAVGKSDDANKNSANEWFASVAVAGEPILVLDDPNFSPTCKALRAKGHTNITVVEKLIDADDAEGLSDEHVTWIAGELDAHISKKPYPQYASIYFDATCTWDEAIYPAVYLIQKNLCAGKDGKAVFGMTFAFGRGKATDVKTYAQPTMENFLAHYFKVKSYKLVLTGKTTMTMIWMLSKK